MLIQASQVDQKEIVAYLEQESVRNLLFLADIEKYGLEQDFQTVWYEKRDSHLMVVLLKYHNNFILYSDQQKYSIDAVLALLRPFSMNALSMSIADYRYLKPFLKGMDSEVSAMCKLDNPVMNHNLSGIMRATPKDARAIIASLNTIEEFSRFRGDSLEEQIAHREKGIVDDFNRHFFMKKNGIVIANANTSCMSKNAGMVGGVFTLPFYRGQGYAKQVVSALCNDLLKEGRTPCLYYVNPIAGKMYHELGFHDFDEWVITTPIR